MSGRLILVRHGQSLANVERRLDTRPPGAELTEDGRLQAREFARSRRERPGVLLHSIANRAAQTAAEISAELATEATAVEGIHEVQAGDLEDRTDDEAIAAFNAVYQQWHEGALDVAAEPELGAWDIGAIIPIVTEAGGRITAFDGRPALDGGCAVTTNGLLHDEVLRIIGSDR